MFTATYKVRATRYVALRPRISAASPIKAGATVATAMYEVIVKLILSIETESESASWLIAGK